jgi:alanine-synthesizing transaminase
MCLALMGPGDTAIVPSPYFPIHVYAVVLASGNVITLDVRDPEKYLENIAYTCEHIYPRPKVVIANFPHNPSSTVIEQDFFVELVRLAKKYEFLVLSDFAYADICYDGYKAPSFLATPGVYDDEQELQHGRLADRLLLRKRRDGPGAGNHQRLLRLRDFPGDPDRGDHCDAPL